MNAHKRYKLMKIESVLKKAELVKPEEMSSVQETKVEEVVEKAVEPVVVEQEVEAIQEAPAVEQIKTTKKKKTV